MAQRAIANLCEAIWLSGLPGGEVLIPALIPYVLLASIQVWPECVLASHAVYGCVKRVVRDSVTSFLPCVAQSDTAKEADVKRVHGLRTALTLLDIEDDSFASIKVCACVCTGTSKICLRIVQPLSSSLPSLC